MRDFDTGSVDAGMSLQDFSTSSQTETPLCIDLSFANISYSVKEKRTASQQQDHKRILDRVTGYLPAGSFLAILGPSGAGKSSLLDILAGREKSGVVWGFHRMNGQSVERFKLQTAYVMQDDALLGNLTVFETLMFTLKLRLPSGSLTKPEMEERALAIIADLNLEKVTHQRVGTSLQRGISGGERRRLSIGIELVTSPRILFLDEPTTGLDSTNALRVMRALKHLCEKHLVTIVTTVHQPRSNIFRLFDRLLLLDAGRTVYFGQAADAVEYWRQLGYECPQYMNPADFFLDSMLAHEKEQPDDESPLLASREEAEGSLSAEELAEAYCKSPEFINVAAEVVAANGWEDHSNLSAQPPVLTRPKMKRKTEVSVWRQLFVLTQRTWKETIRDPNIVYIRTVAAIVISLLLGLIFFQTDSSGDIVNSILFLMCVFSLFCLPAISKFIEQRLIYSRESASGVYGAFGYQASNFIVEFPILLIMVLVYVNITYWMVGYTASFGHFIFFFSVVLEVVIVGFGFAQVLAASLKSVNLAIALYVFVLVYSLLLGGFIVSIDDLPSHLTWLIYTSYFYYGFAALIINEFEDSACCYDVIPDMNLENASKWRCFGGLLLILLGLKVLEYLALRFLHREKK